MKKILSGFLASAMVFSMGAVAFAADDASGSGDSALKMKDAYLIPIDAFENNHTNMDIPGVAAIENDDATKGQGAALTNNQQAVEAVTFVADTSTVTVDIDTSKLDLVPGRTGIWVGFNADAGVAVATATGNINGAVAEGFTGNTSTGVSTLVEFAGDKTNGSDKYDLQPNGLSWFKGTETEVDKLPTEMTVWCKVGTTTDGKLVVYNFDDGSKITFDNGMVINIQFNDTREEPNPEPTPDPSDDKETSEPTQAEVAAEAAKSEAVAELNEFVSELAKLSNPTTADIAKLAKDAGLKAVGNDYVLSVDMNKLGGQLSYKINDLAVKAKVGFELKATDGKTYTIPASALKNSEANRVYYTEKSLIALAAK